MDLQAILVHVYRIPAVARIGVQLNEMLGLLTGFFKLIKSVSGIANLFLQA
jgi:hypothetical protein